MTDEENLANSTSVYRDLDDGQLEEIRIAFELDLAKLLGTPTHVPLEQIVASVAFARGRLRIIDDLQRTRLAKTVFRPVLGEGWVRMPGVDAEIHLRDGLRYDEDIYAAHWNGWVLWLDGGKSIKPWQCCLVEPREEGRREHHFMRDFFDTTSEVQAWIDKACVLAQSAAKAR